MLNIFHDALIYHDHREANQLADWFSKEGLSSSYLFWVNNFTPLTMELALLPLISSGIVINLEAGTNTDLQDKNLDRHLQASPLVRGCPVGDSDSQVSWELGTKEASRRRG